jgi:TfoX/Sxy family transcriptional regulator of competence genes
MAYDEDLADRIRQLLAGRGNVSEQKMFGGLGFLVGGHMAIAASGEGGILVRADPIQSDKLVQTTGAEMAVMRGRPMAGWLRVSAEDLANRRQLEKWVKVGVGYAGSLAGKGSGTAPARNPTKAPAKRKTTKASPRAK